MKSNFLKIMQRKLIICFTIVPQHGGSKMKQRNIFALLTVVVCATTALLGGRATLAQESFFTGNFSNWSLTIDTPNTGAILGSTDLEVSHPFWVSNRPNHGGAKDPTDLLRNLSCTIFT